jgi:hypothetical protein
LLILRHGRRQILSIDATAHQTRVGRTKAYELINAGKIIAYKQGHQTMIDTSESLAQFSCLGECRVASVQNSTHG